MGIIGEVMYSTGIILECLVEDETFKVVLRQKKDISPCFFLIKLIELYKNFALALSTRCMALNLRVESIL